MADDGGGSTGGEFETSGETGDVALPPGVVDEVEACMQELVASPQLSGAAVAVVSGGARVWTRGFGVRQPGSEDSVDAETRFRVGSITKVMTATAGLALVADGALELDAPVSEVLPPFGDPAHPEYRKTLTLRHLLSHQGGLYDFFTIDGPRGDAALGDAVLGELFRTVPYLVEPGTFYNYSNANYAVAGLLVERAAGMPYAAAVGERVFEPLTMTRSTFDVEEVAADGNYARAVVDGGVFEADAYDNGWARPAGFAWSSADDLARLVGFLQRGDADVLPRQAHAELLRPQVDTLSVLDRVRYGFGLTHRDYITVEDGVIEYDNVEHAGSLPGYTALVHLSLDLDLGLAFVANGNEADFYPCIAAAVSAFPDFDATPTYANMQAGRTDFDAFIGDWVEPLSGDFTITDSERGFLQISFPDLDRAGVPYFPELIPIARDNFHVIIDGTVVRLTGIYDDTGELAYLRTRRFVARPADRERHER